MTPIRFDGRTAIVTGAGLGLGRCHALGLAARGANVVVNDLGVTLDGSVHVNQAAQAVVDEITSRGGRAIASGADVRQPDQVDAMVEAALSEFGAVDILVNNAGILRDKSFGKMDAADFQTVVDVHLVGSVTCTRAVWTHMAERNYGRIVMTTSSSGMYGNFGQSAYGCAKAGVVGFMNVLAEEGRRKNIRVNTLSPTAATRMTESLVPPEAAELLKPETITPGLLVLVGEDAPTKMILAAGAGGFAEIRICETPGVALSGDDLSPEGVLAAFDRIRDPEAQEGLPDAFAQTRKFVAMAAAEHGLSLSWT